MKSILGELYHGNINPNEKPFNYDSEYRKIVKALSDSEESLLKLLNDDGKTLFEKFSHAHNDLDDMSEADAFVDDFSLGMIIAFEVMGEQF